MRSSDLAHRLTRVASQCLVAATLASTACSPPPNTNQSAVIAPAHECVVSDVGISPADADAIASLRRTVEAGPMYAASNSTPGVAACRAGSKSGTITLEYTLRDGGWLRVTRQPDIEYTDQEVRFVAPLAENPVSVLARAEEAAFGASRCGIDWQKGEMRPAGDDPNATETIYRGDVCNCQARVRADAAGRVMGLAFRSAC